MAILLGEREAPRFVRAILDDAVRLTSAFTLLETGMVIEARKGPEGTREWELLRFRFDLEVVPLTHSHAEIAFVAFRRFGKGRRPAGLNIGDCCSYALAKATGQPLLYKGDDFGRCDVGVVDFGSA